MSKSNRHKKRCFWCHVRDCPLTNDHVVPLAFGGKESDDNVRRACWDCNQERGRIVHAATTIFRAARGNYPERSQRKAREWWESLKESVAKWCALEHSRLGGRSVSDKLGSAEYPFLIVPTKRRSSRDVLDAARKVAESREPLSFS